LFTDNNASTNLITGRWLQATTSRIKHIGILLFHIHIPKIIINSGQTHLLTHPTTITEGEI
jgi:hypothetical protein